MSIGTFLECVGFIFILVLMLTLPLLWRNRQTLFALARNRPALAVAAASRSTPDSAIHRVWEELRRLGLHRLWLELRRLGLIGMAVAFSAMLSVASFFTTYQGMQNFTQWEVVALLAAIGIQGTLYIASWLVARESAMHGNRRRRKLKAVEEDNPDLGDSLWSATTRPLMGFIFYVAEHPFSVLTLVICLCISVFFSFDALFDKVYSEPQRLLTNRKVARSEIGGVFGDLLAEMHDARTAEAEKLRASPEWTHYQQNLETILSIAADAKKMIKEATDAERSRMEGDLAAARQRVAAASQDVATLQAQYDALAKRTPETANADAASLQDRITRATQHVAELQATIDELTSTSFDITAKLNAEDKAGGIGPDGKRRLTGKGPVWRDLDRQLKDVEANLGARKDELAQAKAELDTIKRESETADASKISITAQFSNKKGELASLQNDLDDLQKRYDQLMAEDSTSVIDTGGAAGLVAKVDQAITVFSGTGSNQSFKEMVAGCSTVVDLLERSPDTKKSLGGRTCDTSAIAPYVNTLAAIDLSLDTFAKSCTVDDEFNGYGTVGKMVDRGRKCLSLANLPSHTSAPQRDMIDRVEQENSPDTSHFERTTASLRRGDVLAWLALFIAFAIDFLVLISAILGARTLSSPLVSGGFVATKSELDDINALNHFDPLVYPDDPIELVNQKVFVSLVMSESGDGVGNRSIVNLNRIPPEYALHVAAFVSAATTSDPPRAHAERGRPGVYRIENSLVQHFMREVGLYEMKHQKLYGARDREIGERIQPSGLDLRAFGPDSDPFEPFEAASAEPASQAEPRGAQPGAPPPVRRPPRWPSRHPDTKTYYRL